MGINVNKWGSPFSPAEKMAVWAKGQAIPGYDPLRWRRDSCNFNMDWNEYGNRQSVNGWEIDHIIPLQANGTDHLSNLQPLNWRNNSSKGDSLTWRCGQ